MPSVHAIMLFMHRLGSTKLPYTACMWHTYRMCRTWDTWMRKPHIRKGRQCICPEISRTLTFGVEGTSAGALHDLYFKPMVLNKRMVDWPTVSIAYLEPSAYDQRLDTLLGGATVVNMSQLSGTSDTSPLPPGDLLVHYTSVEDFEQDIALKLPPMLPSVQVR